MNSFDSAETAPELPMVCRRFLLLASLTLSALNLAGCPTDPSGGDNSNSADNENGSTANSNGSSNDNGSGLGNSNDNGSENSNGGGSANENGSGGSNENSNSSSSNSNDNGDAPGPSIIAAWSGTLTCERTQALSGSSPGNPVTSTQSLAITFGSDNKPASIVILGYSGFADQTVTIKNAGETVTNNVSASNYDGTMKITINSADYRSDRCEIVIDIVLQTTSNSGNGATQNGTGRQTISARTVDGGLEYTAESDYEVRLQATAGIQLDVTESKTCTGTLVK